jgi:anaerobic dimethyl sulfoxide reductase subunit A
VQEFITGCPHDCGASCPLKVYVEDGVARRLAPEDGPDSLAAPRLRPCVKGLAQLQRVYHPDRLLHPMKRVGERGEGRFLRISWDEALDTVAGEMRRIKETHGPRGILNLRAAGNTDGLLHRTSEMVNRFFNGFGGQTGTRASISCEGAQVASRATFGFFVPPPSPESLLHSKLVIMWGFNPSESLFGTNTNYYLALARERGTRFISVDPRFTDSAAALADQWIPIRPGTDTAMLVAMAFVIIQERLHDETYLRRYTHGFEQFREYCLGLADGVPRDPTWAEPICGVRAEVIAGLAREYATTKPADLRGGWSPGRTAYGEQFHRACAVLSAMTGNAGIPGGGPGCWFAQDYEKTLGVSNLPSTGTPTGTVPAWQWPEAVLQGTAGGYPSDIKMIYSIGGNRLNQCADVNKGIRALKKVEFVVVQDQFLTTMARFADVVLPASTNFEREDVQLPHSQGNYLIHNSRVIAPLGESRSDLEILTALSQKLGIANFNDRTDEEWLRGLIDGTPVDYDGLRARGVYRFEPPYPESLLEEFVAAPEEHPLPTPSGKIEIYSQTMAERGSPKLPPIPQYLGEQADPGPSSGDYPLLLITTHTRKRVHSTFDNVPWLRELEPHTVLLSSLDAEVRGLRSGEKVRVYNDIGTMIVEVRVTERLMPGVVAIDEGAWYRPDEEGRDWGGCVNVLCPDTLSPAEAAATNGIPVQVALFKNPLFQEC